MLLDEALTMSARMSAAAGDLNYEKRYNELDPQLDTEITRVRNVLPQLAMEQCVRETDEANTALVKIERQAFALTHQGKRQEALLLLTNETYATLKQMYAQGMQRTMRVKDDLLRNETRRAMLISNVLLGANVSGILMLLMAWYCAASSAHAWAAERVRSENMLQAARDGLEIKVSQRTAELNEELAGHRRAQAELEAAQRELIAASRAAGMAEVATNVLHNVGNVLNSVNVSTAVLFDRLKASKAAQLSKVAALMEEHRVTLGEFITGDPRGKELPDYLAGLGAHMTAERDAMLKEIASLTANIEHIKDIVAMQQSYGQVAGVKETVSPMDLVDDALRLNSDALIRHGIQIVREYHATPRLVVEKHRIVQILVNLIQNAKYALDERRTGEKLLTVRVGLGGGDGYVRIEVVDNGGGIEPEAMPRIFEHGFTTRLAGHGFGLHSAVLTARQMGGTLTARSDGPGCGATFTLDIPAEAGTDVHDEHGQQ